MSLRLYLSRLRQVEQCRTSENSVHSPWCLDIMLEFRASRRSKSSYRSTVGTAEPACGTKLAQHESSGKSWHEGGCNLSLMLSHIHVRRILILVVFWLALGGAWAMRGLAQSSDAPWTTPVNISRSGAASQPVIAAAPDGTLHVLWWDVVDGEQYAQTTDVTGTTWSKPVGVEPIVGMREVNDVTNRVTLTAPREVRVTSDARGNAYAFWYDVDNRLLTAQIQGAGPSNMTVLSDAALNIDAAADVSGTLRLVYVRPTGSQDSPPGIYYRATSGGGEWSIPSLVYTSTYFRVAKPEQVHLSVAGDGLGRILVAWDDLALGRSLYARSTDGGRTWGAAQSVIGDSSSQAVHARVASALDGTFLMLWQDASAGGCALSQRRSADGGQTWSAPERILTDLSRCPGRWEFAPAGDGRLWLVGLPLSDGSSAQSASSGTLAAWDSKTWSKPVEVSLSFRDATTQRSVSLGRLSIAVSGNSVGIVGCDASGDVWAVRNAVGLERLLPALRSVWSVPEVLSNEQGQPVNDLPAVAADAQGKVYTLWSQSASEGQPGAALYAAVWDGSRWSRAAQVLRSPDTSSGILASDRPVGKSEQPALVANGQNKLHAVWSGGTRGEIFYSWTYARDVISPQSWAEPVALPSVTTVASWPDMLADPRGSVLHVIYAVPYNEKRGIYYVRSNDGGSTWLTPTVVFDAVAAGWDSVNKPRLVLDAKADVLHAVWLRASLPGAVETQAIVYARSTDGGKTWSSPVHVAEGAVDWPRVAVSGAGQVYLVWNQARVRSEGVTSQQSAEVWGRFSPDGGQRWSEAARVRGFEQVSGPVSLASDGVGGLTLVGVAPGASSESELLYSRWDGRAWSECEIFGLGQDATWGNAAVAVMVPNMSELNVVLRELLKLADGTEQFGVVAMGRDVQVTSAAAPAPTFTPLPTFTPTVTATPLPTATPAPQVNLSDPVQLAGRGSIKSQIPLVLGGALVAVIVLATVVWRVIWMVRH
jgi:hypothetical protein